MSRPRSHRSVPAAAAVAALLFLLFVTIDAPTADNGLEHQVAQLNERITDLEAELAGLAADVRSQHPDPRMEQEAAQALQGINSLIREGHTEQARDAMDAFMASYRNTQSGRQAASLHRELGVVGRAVPEEWNFAGWFQGENDIDLSSDGPTILVFWETWCPHCRRAMPTLQQTYAKYKSRGLSIVGLTKLTRDSTDQKVTEFMAQHKLMYPMAKEDGTMSTYFNVGGIPSSAVLKNGKVVWSGHPAAINDGMIEGWLSDATS